MRRLRRASLVGAVVLTFGSGGSAGQGDGSPADVSVETYVERAGAWVKTHFAAVRTIVAREDVTLQDLGRRGRPDGAPRRFVYETRVEWGPAEGGGTRPPVVHRELQLVDGRLPRTADDECLAPAGPDPLALLLPESRRRFAFAPAPAGPDPGGSSTVRLTYAPLAEGVPMLEWHGRCATMDAAGLTHGVVVFDRATGAVRRIEESLVRPVTMSLRAGVRPPGWGPTLTVEQADVVVEYEDVRFRDPDEIIRLPRTITRRTFARTPGERRLAVEQTFSAHRRFLAEVRVRPAR